MTIRHGLKDRIIVASGGNHISPQYTANLHSVMAQQGEHHGNEHARWRDWRKDLTDKHRAFAIVRNPWSRTVSRFTFAQHIDDPSCKKGFRAFLDERHTYGDVPYFWHRAIRGWYPQADYVTQDGELQCDVMRFGTGDVEQYMGLDKPLRIRNISNTEHKNYRDFYTPETHDIVADWYKQDVDYFGFTFDGHATRNIWTPS